ncbi:MAG TPA: SMP-30/gluconolactonase/LRE family protein [Tabrizicola sp.]|nr:SMP-30/gluconolactonase/LRE family protein [Tabrizicola sp.]
MIYDDRPCELGEGPLWHPMRGQLFWFDILGQRMLSVEKGEQRQWRFPEMVSAAGWVDRDMLLIAGERDLFLFDVETEETHSLIELESDNRTTRSNDGRADPYGGFWIGTMGRKAEKGAGAIYRYYRGELRRLFGDITISNAICFSPDGRTAHFTDTVTHRVMRVALDSTGWPQGEPEVFLDLTHDPSGPDGAVVDAQGLFWLAQWGAARVSAFAPDGSLVRHVAFDAPQTSCPAFGGPGLTALFCTSALEDMDAAARSRHPNSGMTFMAEGVAKGQMEHRVLP